MRLGTRVQLIDIRLAAAIAAGKAAGMASRLLGRGGGTTLPGVVARRIAPNTLRRISAALPQGVVLVAGTNGKTTTTRMIATMLTDQKRNVLHNRAGANLVSGLTATALSGSSVTGRVRADLGLFETDEAALPDALAETQPRLVLLNNLFRDQLDRYGEVDTIAGRWRTALAQLPATATVLLNADDPAIAALGEGLTARVLYYGLEDTRHATGAAMHIADSQFCRRCGAPYYYDAVFYAHIGHYRCEQCGHQRPQPHIKLERLDLSGTAGSRLFVSYPARLATGIPLDAERSYLEIALPLPGLYNANNALAASAAALLLGLTPVGVRSTLEAFSAAFGRIERVDANGKPLLMALIKNPVGASETVRMLTTPEQPDQPVMLDLLVAINDKYADGTDVSWLWDADFERLAGHVARAVVGGPPAADMAVRLKYAGVEQERIVVEPDLATAVDRALAQLPPGRTLYTLPTYTAMLELRAELARRNWVRPFWED
jgi:UDP-N-acetylmuramyl tripeptide synthase